MNVTTAEQQILLDNTEKHRRGQDTLSKHIKPINPSNLF